LATGKNNAAVIFKRTQDFSVVFELLNNQNKVIGRQTLQASGSWGFGWSETWRDWKNRYRPKVSFSSPAKKTVNFQNVNANDITDKMTIRVASANGTDAEIAAKTGSLQIRTFIKEITAGAALKDTRDGKSYRTVVVGNQIWMAENLNYQASGSKCDDNKAANCAKYGRLYDWPTAIEACPAGWHLPSYYEWETLMEYVRGMGGIYDRFVGELRSWWSGDEYLSDEYRQKVNEYGAHLVGAPPSAWYRRTYTGWRVVGEGDIDYARKSNLFSVSCVQN
jgi:uncharacterized protein (TIGR02145 family)